MLFLIFVCKNSLEYVKPSSSSETYLFNLKSFFFFLIEATFKFNYYLLSFWLYKVTYDMHVFSCEMRGFLVSSRFFFFVFFCEYIDYDENVNNMFN